MCDYLVKVAILIDYFWLSAYVYYTLRVCSTENVSMYVIRG